MRTAHTTFAVAGLLALATPVRAQDVQCDNPGDFPCALQIEDVGIKPVPSVLKFQARVSQAKLPVGEGTFPLVHVNVLSGTTTVCSERFRDVQVRDGIINISIGQNLDCDIPTVVAENGDLKLQICPGGPTACLPAIPITPAPYAVKSETAGLAQHAHRVDVAAQAQYTHRLAADTDLLNTDTLNAGYIDFETPAGSDHGHIRWVPVRDRSALSLLISARDANADLALLGDLVVNAEETRVDGALTLAPAPAFGALSARVDASGLHVTGPGSIAGTLNTSSTLTVTSGGAELAQGAFDVTGDTLINGNVNVGAPLTVAQAMTVETGGLTVAENGISATGDSFIRGNTTSLGRLPVAGNVTVTTGGMGILAGDLDVQGSASWRNDLTMTGTLVPLGGVQVGAGGLFVDAGNLNVAGTAQFGANLEARSGLTLSSETRGNLAAQDTLTAGTLTVAGTATAASTVSTTGILRIVDQSQPAFIRPALAVLGNDGDKQLRLGDADGYARVRAYQPVTAEGTFEVGSTSNLASADVSGLSTVDNANFSGDITLGDEAGDLLRFQDGLRFVGDPGSVTRFEGTTAVSQEATFSQPTTFTAQAIFNGPILASNQVACPVGFGPPEGGGRCQEIDECGASSTGPCPANKYCVNTFGSFRCVDP